ncbi:MAG: cytochrome P450 [Acidimicrobiales bacterium]
MVAIETPPVMNPFDHGFHADPYPVYRRLRDEAPCYYNPDLDFYALSRYQDVMEASQQPLLYSSAEGTTLERLDTQALLPMMIFMDPPEHDVNRKLVGRAFTPRGLLDLEPAVRRYAVEFLEPLQERGGGDFVKEFSALLPSNVIMELLGVPREDREMLREWIDATLERVDEPPFIPDQAMEAMAKAGEYWAALVTDKRRHQDDKLMSRLCEAEVEGDDGARTKLTDKDVVGFCSLIASAGTETLTKLLASAVVLFHQHHGEWEKVLSDRSVIPAAVEETLRYSPPSQYQGRVLTDEVSMHGTTMPKGARVLLLTGGANRDEREFEEPDRFDIGRPAHLALGFGHGIHFCLGAALARLEGRVGLEEFASRFPRFEVDEDDIRRVHMSNVHGFSSVPFRSA